MSSTLATPPVTIPNCGRNDLAGVFKLLGFTVGVEVGTWRAEFSEYLCQQLPQTTVISVDVWKTGYDAMFTNDAEQCENERQCRERLRPYPNSVILKTASTTAAAMFPPRSLDFVYLDADHRFPSVVADLCAWQTRIRPGGIMAGHDYVFFRDILIPSHVPQALEGFTHAYRINPWAILGSQAAVEGEVRDKHRSWCFLMPRRSPTITNTENWDSLGIGAENDF
jgi:hypothetical protein